MNISTVLSSIQSLLDANPITNEPGYEKLALTPGSKAETYAEMVRFRLMSHTLPGLLRAAKGDVPAEWAEFADVLVTVAPGLAEKAVATVAKYAEKEGVIVVGSLPYSMQGLKTDWKGLQHKVAAATSR